MGKTRRQWLLEGRIPKDGVPGIEDWTNGFCQRKATYWAENDTREATADEIEEFKECERKKKRDQYAARKAREKRHDEYVDYLHRWKTAYQWLADGKVPKDGATWKLGERLNGREYHAKGSTYYYCIDDDVIDDPELAEKLINQYPDYPDKNGDFYDGLPWWGKAGV